VDPRYGGILAAAPITTTLAFLFLYNESGQDLARQLVINAFYFAIPTVLFLLVLYLLMNRFSFLPGLGGAYGIRITALLGMNCTIAGFRYEVTRSIVPVDNPVIR
jgi:ABC-type tungstate transport system substrate-binding protein